MRKLMLGLAGLWGAMWLADQVQYLREKDNPDHLEYSRSVAAGERSLLPQRGR